MSEDEVDLTVVIAALNAADTIGAQLAALAEQRCPVRWEVLVCDNGSTDATAQVVQAAAARGGVRPSVRYVDASATRGAGAARNVGAEQAAGRWLAFCDADDVVGEHWLAAMAEALSRHRFVAGRFDGTRLNGQRASRSRPLDQQEGLQSSPDVIGLPHAGAGNMAIDRELFRRAGGFDLSIPCLEDTDLSWRVQLQFGVRLHYAHDAVVHVRLRPQARAMFRQGKAYGSAYALLERRFGDCPGASDGLAPAGDAQVAVHTAWLRRGAALRAWLGTFPSLGTLVWQLGWHRGYRQGSAGPTDSRSANPASTIELGAVGESRDAG